LTGTQQPEAISFDLNGRRIVLIDTPGFDDDLRLDVEVLEDIAKWMARKDHLKENLLDGLIFLHPITLNRVGGSERRRTRLLEKILGPGAYGRVIIATTMWDVLSANYDVEARLKGRTSVGGVWHDMISQGALLLQHKHTADSAKKIIQIIADMANRSRFVEVQLQVELKSNRNRINDTAVGRELKRQLESDIALLKQELVKHRRNRPQPLPPLQRPVQQRHRQKASRGSRVTEGSQREESKLDAIRRKEERIKHKIEMKEWQGVESELSDRLDLKSQQLKRLNGLGVSTSFQGRARSLQW